METLPNLGATLTRQRTGTNPVSSSPKKQQKKSTSLPTSTVEYLKAWMMSPEHIAHPYPTEQEKLKIMQETGIELKQLTNWFVNNRKRYWKPRVEARLQDKDVNSKLPKTTSVSSLTLSNVVSSTSFKSLLEKTAVDEQKSLTHCVSETGSVTSEDLSDDSSAVEDQHFHTETIDLYIVKPGKASLTLDHIVTEPATDHEILKTYQDCVLSFRITGDAANRRKFVLAREAEIKNLKKNYLDLYKAESKIKSPLKRKIRESSSMLNDTVTPRPKFRRMSVELWKEACHTASNSYDDVTLPSLEEATRLFGYSCN